MARRRRLTGKKRSNHKHFSRRLLERTGMTNAEEVEAEIVQQIQSGKSSFVCKSSNARTLHEVRVGGGVLTAVYDKLRKQVITILLPEEDYHGR